MSFQVETSSSPVQLSSLHNRQQCHSIFSPLSLSTRRLGCQSELFDLQKISGNSNNNNNCRYGNSRRTVSLSAFSEDSSDSDNDEYEVVRRRELLPPRRVKIRARTASASASTAKNANPNNQRTTKSTTSITTPAATTSTTSSSYSSKMINSRTKSGAPYQHQEMLDHTILSPAEELTFGRQVVRARILRDKIEELILEKQHQKQQEIQQQRLQQRRGEELLETEDDDEEEDRTTSGNADGGHLDYNFLTYELEYLSVYGYCRSSSSSRSNNKDTTVAPLPAIRNRNKFEELDNDNDYDDDEEEEEKEVDRLLLGGYDLHDDLLFEHAMHRSEHHSQLRRRRHHHHGDSNGGVLGGDGNTLDDVESRRNNLHQQQRFGPKRTGYRNGSTSSTNRNSYSSLLNIPLHKLDDSDVRMLLESIDIMDGVVVEPAGGTIGTEGETNNGRVVLVNILLDGSYARETLMRRNVKLVMSIAKNWMRNSFTTANSNNNNIPGDSGGGGGGSGSGSSGKRGGDKSSKRYLAQMYEGSWDKPSLDEAVQEGMLGLARAVDKFDPERGLRFSTYATHWVTSYVRVCFQRAVTGCLRVPSQLHDIRSAYNQIVKDYLHLGSTPPAQESIAQQLNISEQRLHTAIRATGTLLSVDAPVMSGGSSGNYKGSMAGGDGRNSQELMLLDTLKW